MKKAIWIGMVLGCFSMQAAGADYSIGLSGSDGRIDGFSFSIGEYYQVPYSQVRVIERSVPREEMSVVYYLAHYSHRDPRHIIGLRQRGLGWWDISVHLGLNPYALFALQSGMNPYPPYGVANGHTKRHLYDREVIDVVNTRFLSDYYRVNADEIIRRRQSGERFMNIDDYYRSQRHVEQHYRESAPEQWRGDRNDRQDEHWNRGHGNSDRSGHGNSDHRRNDR
ncbi:MAG: hypothetical protein AB7S65_02320 [Sulfuricurvum sp.]